MTDAGMTDAGTTDAGTAGAGRTGAGLTGASLVAVLRAGLARELGDAVRLRHDLHANPEVSGSEHRTAARVAAALEDADAPPVAGTGRLVRIGPRRGPCIAIRAELDALPVVEQTGAPWAASNGAMHACGHDVHMAALAALGRAARRVGLPAEPPAGLPGELTAVPSAGLPGELTAGPSAPLPAGLPAALLAVLQPSEEAEPSGAREIMASAAFAAQQPGAVIAVHLQPQLPAGTVSAPAGTVNASADDFEIRVQGAAGHAGYPHLAADPVLALCQTIVALQQIVSRRTDPTHGAAVSVGALQAGQAPNVIPPAATARGTLRALDQADRAAMRTALREIVEHTSAAHGCEGSVTIDEGEPSLVNDAALATASWPWLREAGFAVDTSFRSCGSDDFAFYGGSAPSLMIFLGTGGPVSLHHPRFLPDDDMVGQVASAMLAGYLGAQSLLSSRPDVARLPR